MDNIISEEDKLKAKDLYDKGLISYDNYSKICTPPKSTECFDATKAKEGLINLNNKVLWMKDISSLFNIRKIIIYLIIGILIIGGIYGYGYWKGLQGKPVILNLQGKEEFIALNDHYLYILKNGTMQVLDKDKKTVLKEIKVGDIEGLRKLLKPYGFQLKPFFTAGGSIGNKSGFEAGAGIDFFKWFRANLNGFLTNRGIYLGVGYQITDNFDALVGAGKGYKNGDTRVYIGGKWKF